jgi:Family of unknown function (DUF6328)
MTVEEDPVRTGSPEESAGEHADRNFVELLQGLRVAVTGVQVLFVFLLTVPFAPGFARVAAADRSLFYVALTSAATASMFFIAPSPSTASCFAKASKNLSSNGRTSTA